MKVESDLLAEMYKRTTKRGLDTFTNARAIIPRPCIGGEGGGGGGGSLHVGERAVFSYDRELGVIEEGCVIGRVFNACHCETGAVIVIQRGVERGLRGRGS